MGNALVVLSKLGVRAEVIGAFADDNAGAYLLGDFQKYGVETKNAGVRERYGFFHFVYRLIRKRANAYLRVRSGNSTR